MYNRNRKLEKRINQIKMSFYKWHGEREEKSLEELASYFNIPIEEKRKDDYIIKRLSFDDPSIEIYDKKTDITYKAKYTTNADLFNHIEREKKFINLIVETLDYRIEKLYHINYVKPTTENDDRPIIERMTFKDGDYSLVFEREYDNNLRFFQTNSDSFKIQYTQRVEDEGKLYQQPLLTRNYAEKEITDPTYSYEDMYTYSEGGINAIKTKDKQFKYSYLRNNGVIHVVDRLENKATETFLRDCHCFEVNNEDDIRKSLPYGVELDSEVTEKDISGMIFYGFVKGLKRRIKIFKDKSKIRIKYYVGLGKEKNYEDDVQEYSFPIINNGSISNNEIKMICLFLQLKYSNDPFIDLILEELTTFGNKIDIRKGLKEEELDMLNPKQYMHKPFEGLASLISENKEEFFKEAATQFDDATNISIGKGKVNIMVQA